LRIKLRNTPAIKNAMVKTQGKLTGPRIQMVNKQTIQDLIFSAKVLVYLGGDKADLPYIQPQYQLIK
jgi:hypothetical protein